MSVLIKDTNIEDLQRAMLMFRGHEIVELPDHGDLIDRDAMRKDWKFSDSCNRCERDAYRCQYHEEMSTMDVCGMLDDAPVVIPAERK